MKPLKYILMCYCIAFFSACTYDNAGELYGEKSVCITAEEASFSADVKPVLETRCLNCHSTAAHKGAGGGIDLQAFNSLKAYAESGALVGAINHDPDYTPMPLNGAKLEECVIDAIVQWVESGANQN